MSAADFILLPNNGAACQWCPKYPGDSRHKHSPKFGFTITHRHAHTHKYTVYTQTFSPGLFTATLEQSSQRHGMCFVNTAGESQSETSGGELDFLLCLSSRPQEDTLRGSIASLAAQQHGYTTHPFTELR